MELSTAASSLAEIDSLEILVIIDNELDPISPVSPDTVQAWGNMGHIAMSTAPRLAPGERGDAALELRMENICCAAHGLSIMIVSLVFLMSVSYVLEINRLEICRPPRKATSNIRCCSTPVPKSLRGRGMSRVSKQTFRRWRLFNCLIGIEIIPVLCNLRFFFFFFFLFFKQNIALNISDIRNQEACSKPST